MMNESYRRERGAFTDEQKGQRTADEQISFFGPLSEFTKWRKRKDVSALGVESVRATETGNETNNSKEESQ